jgi:hypothetical protein
VRENKLNPTDAGDGMRMGPKALFDALKVFL